MGYYGDMHIRYQLTVLAALAVLFGFAAPALADSFSFSCQPYTLSFESGKHYLPSSNGTCAFAIPATVSGSNRSIAIYKGVPGNSILIATKQTLNAADTLDVVFGSPATDQNYFAAAYDAGAADAFANSFSTGSSTNTQLPPNSTSTILRWKWGPKSASEYNPVVIVPDILDSWTTDSGGVVDPIFHTYQNLTDTLVGNGYIQNQTLFTFPYNWEKGNITSAQALATKIQNIKSTCGCSQVDVIAHGTGGYVVEQYIVSAGYGHDIGQAVFLGTPFLGAPVAYQAWEGGQIHFSNSIQDGLAQVFLSAEAKDNGYANVFSYVQGKPTSGFQELLPIAFPYLDVAAPANTVLQTLFPQTASIFSHDANSPVNAHVVSADDGLGQTTSGFTTAASSQPPLWPDGQPVSTNLDTGDGMIPWWTTDLAHPADQTFATSHLGLPTAAESDTFLALTGKNPSTTVHNSYPVSCVLFISISSQSDMQISDPNGSRIGKNFATNAIYSEIPSSVYSGFNAPTEYGAVANPLGGLYTVQTQGQSNGSFTINASDVCGNNVVSTGTTSPSGGGTYGITIGTTTQSITIVGINTKAPLTVTANNQAISLGASIPPLTATLSGFVNGETATSSGVTGAASCTTTATATSSIGSYPITCSVGSLTSNKYEFKTFVPGTLTITYRWDGFLQPINDTGHQIGQDVSVFKAGSTVPVKFQLKNAAGAVVQSATLPLWLSPEKGSVMSAPVDESVYTDPASSGSNYSWDGSQYKYNWSTKGLQSGYWYRIYAKLSDGTTQSVVIGLK
jgi:hypothetical protein